MSQQNSLGGWWPRLALIGSVMLGGSPSLLAQDVDAGKLLQQLPQQQAEPLPKPLLPEQQNLDTSVAPSESTGPTVTVSEWVINDPMNLLSAEERAQIAAQIIGQQLDYNSIIAYRDAITIQLKQKGYVLARAFLPRQDVSAGRIEVDIIAGQVSAAKPFEIVSASEQQTERQQRTAERLGAIAAYHVKSGSALSQADLEQSLLTMNDLSGIDVQAKLQAGDSIGETRIQYLVAEKPRHELMLWGNNYGNANTSSDQLNLHYTLNNVRGYGDSFTAFFSLSEGTTTRVANYSRPLHATGWVGSVGVTDMDYQIETEAGRDNNARGEATIYSADATYPILRSRLKNAYFTMGVSNHALTDYVRDEVLNEKDKVGLKFEANGDWVDGWGGGSFNRWQLGLRMGSLNLAVPDTAYLTEGRYEKVTYSLSRLQRIAPQLTFYAQLNGQYALGNLDTSEQMSVGGPYGVRAYSVSEGSGDHTALLNLELRYEVPSHAIFGDVQLKAFYDAGYVRLHKDLGTIDVADLNLRGKNDYVLEGVGVGASFTHREYFVIQAMLASTMGRNKGADFNGLDADGTTDNQRFWLQAVYRF